MLYEFFFWILIELFYYNFRLYSRKLNIWQRNDNHLIDFLYWCYRSRRKVLRADSSFLLFLETVMTTHYMGMVIIQLVLFGLFEYLFIYFLHLLFIRVSPRAIFSLRGCYGVDSNESSRWRISWCDSTMLPTQDTIDIRYSYDIFRSIFLFIIFFPDFFF